MYSKFTCTDLTSSFGSNDMTSDFYSSADAAPTNSLEALKQQLLAATAELTKQEQIAADNKWGYDECDYVKTWGKFKRYGSKDWDGRCRAARSAYDTASGKVAGLKKTIEGLNKQIDAFKSTDPVIVKAQADAQAQLDSSKVLAEAGASRTKIIGWTIAGVILLAGVTWAVMKFRKK